jgi:predicted bacteriocin transport accessory protein
MNSEDKKVAIIFGVLILMVAIVFIGSMANSKKSIEVVAKHKEVLLSSEKQAIYIGRPTCSYCAMFEPVLKEMKEEYNFDYYYINTDELTSAQITDILNQLGIDPNEFGTPYIVFMENGRMVDNHVGYTVAKTFFDKLKENGYVEGNYVAPIEYINYIDFDEYEDIITSEEAQILMIGQTTCTYCIQAKPILNSILKENENLVINYIEFDLLSAEEKEAVNEFLVKNVDEKWGTPLMMVVKNGKQEDLIAGLDSKENYIDFLRINDFIE